MKPKFLLTVFSVMLITTHAYADTKTTTSLDGFYDAIHHYQNKNGKDYARYAPEDVTAISNNILLYQKDNGGWIENQDPARILTPEEISAFTAMKSDPKLSLDNRNTYTQIAYLANAWQITKNPAYKDASLKGLQYMLSLQNTQCGGWPHTLPPKEKYHAYITIADEVTSGVLSTLRQVIAEPERYDFVDSQLRGKIEQAIANGDACLLKLQVVQNGVKTGWAGQYNNETLEPMMGRSYELPSIVSQETVEVLRYLMRIENPSPEIIASINDGAAWLQRSALTGLRIENFSAKPEKYEWHSSDKDRRLVKDPSAPLLWARFYDLKDNSVVLANRDSVRVKEYSEIARERRTGYSWYGTWPAELLKTEYPAWQAKLASSKP
ncbi:pectate lyase [Edaphovirga cremea]|uniref:pectate lyase n=1 Tax=Edaphovirga cremea TaxID=2267246 RepID=UPI003988BBF8